MSGAALPAHELRRLRRVAADEADLDRLVRRRTSGEPLQYLEGTVQFGPIELKSDRRALIPRPETELLWETAADWLRKAALAEPVVVDLCTGSGNLALALKSAWPGARVLATDLSGAALSLAGENAAATGLEVTFLHGDLFAPLPEELKGRVDLLVANPPYVSAAELATLPAEVRDHEPLEALVAGPTGDEVLARIAAEGRDWLAPGGRLFCEIAEMRASGARRLFRPWSQVEVHADLAGRPRILAAGGPG